MKRKIGIAIVLLGLIGQCFAVEQADMPDPLRMTIGARHIGKGRTTALDHADVYGVFTNPASLAELGRPTFTTFYARKLDAFDYNVLAGAFPSDEWIIGVGLAGYTAGAMPKTRYSAEEDHIRTDGSSYSAGEHQALLTIAGSWRSSFLFDVYQIGAGLRLIRQYIDGKQRYGMGVNAGFIVPHFINRNLSVGGVLYNAVQPVLSWEGANDEDRQETHYALGLRYQPADQLNLYCDIESDGMSAGAEYVFLDLYALRAGTSKGSLLAGLGIQFDGINGFGYGKNGLSFDYAFEYDPDADTYAGDGVTHYFSLSVYTQGVSGKPEFNLQEPYAESRNQDYVLRGHAAPGASVILYRNRIPCGKIVTGEDGKWEAVIPLADGLNVVYATSLEKGKEVSAPSDTFYIRKK